MRVTGSARTRLTTRAAIASVTMALLLMVAKVWAAVATDSTAMLGSLADTALDLVASLVTLAGVRIAARVVRRVRAVPVTLMGKAVPRSSRSPFE